MMTDQQINVAITPRTDAFLASNAPVIAVKDFMRQLERELADLKAKQAWRPIATAPKDGTEMLVYVHGDIALMSYQIHCSAWMYSDGSIEDEIDKALWQPLPETPKGSDE